MPHLIMHTDRHQATPGMGPRHDGPCPRPSSWLPRNLSAWIDPAMLVNLVLGIVQMVDDARLRAATAGNRDGSLPPRMLLALVTCGHALGIHSSNAIAARLDAEPVLQYLCAGRRPTAAELRRFRNHNRELLARCLETVCLAVWRIRFGAWGLGLPQENRDVGHGSVRSDPLLQIEMKCEVMERLFQAEVEDSCDGETFLVA